MKLVSIVIPTRNEQDRIASILESINGQTYKNIETIVVDGGSKDNTVKIAKNLGAKVVKETGTFKSLPNAKNQGVKLARGELVIVLDADNELNPEFVTEAVKSYKKGVLGLKCTVEWTEDTVVERILRAVVAKEKGVSPLPMIIPKKYRLAVGGWDPSLGFGEDRDFRRRVGDFVKKNKLKIGYSKKSIIKLHMPHTLSELIKQQRWYGRTILFYLNRSDDWKEYRFLARCGFSLLPFGLLALLWPGRYWEVVALLSAPFWLLTLYRTLRALVKGDIYGIFIPIIDFISGTFMFLGLLESKRKDRGRN